MADFYGRVKEDSRYELIARMAHKDSGHYSAKENTYAEAVEWMDAWIKKRNMELVRRNCPESCRDMVDYLNKIMDKIPIFSSKLISPNTINNFTTIGSLSQ